MPKGPAKTRESAGDDYHRALAEHRQTAPPRLVDQDIVMAVERQTKGMRELSARAFPEPESVLDEELASIETARGRCRSEGEVSR
ncbi:hypothetical protein [Streptomyces sp. NPDC058457]|uniref:hypothetical protein n=1 Tax=Streptomyces sp. NPDC058457 TaxID=3346507 RepID=UPI00364B3BC3